MNKITRKTNRKVVLIFENSWDWHCDFELETAIAISKNNHAIIINNNYQIKIWKLFCNDYRNKLKLFKNICSKHKISFFVPICFLPTKNISFLKKINQFFNVTQATFYLTLRGYLSEKNLLWIFSANSLQYAEYLSKLQVIYDCIDPVLENNKIQQQKQNKLLKLSRINFVNSPYLHREISKFNTKTFLVPCGCKTTYFNTKKIFNTHPADFPKIKNQQVLGISSTIDWRINLDLILFIAQSNPNWHLVIIGPIYGNPGKKWASVLRTANIHYLGVKDKSKLADYYSFFDVCLIPYIFNKKPLKNNPMKFYEYMAMGKPVVSVPIEALECYQPHVKFANNKRDFIKCINIQLGNQKKKSISDRIMIAKTNNWENKIKEMFKQIDKHL